MIHWYTVIPLIVLIYIDDNESSGTYDVGNKFLFSAVVISYFHQSFSASEVLGILFGGFVSTTGIADIDKLTFGWRYGKYAVYNRFSAAGA